MKRILITGAGSYIGRSFEKYIKKYGSAYRVDTLDMLHIDWDKVDFSEYDVIFHVAGIAHQKESTKNAVLYYRVNRDLAIKTAKLSKAAGVSYFVYLSSMSVYGMEYGIIGPQNVPTPKNHYGKSKLQAETELIKLQDEQFKVALLRPPMVYGKDCKGNFQILLKLIRKLPIFPMLANERSMIYIEHLCAFVKLIIDRNEAGLFFPQNQQYTDTCELAKIVVETIPKKMLFSRLLGLLVIICKPFVSKLQKAFGTLKYIQTEQHDFQYCGLSFEETIKRSI